ncbi:MAG TPA: hypothetical protein PKI61_03200 [bacterium]|nr:hypothetical protein [bacterium]HPT30054.1 hypothetical protein [bacterium]
MFGTGEREYNPNGLKLNRDLEIITPGKKMNFQTKGDLRKYEEDITLAETPEELINLGFSKFKHPSDKKSFVFRTERGDQIVYDAKKRKIIDRDLIRTLED